MTPDQIRLRLERVREQPGHEAACWALLELLQEVLPELVSEAQHRTDAGSPGTRYGSHQGDGILMCPYCTPEQPCDRVRQLGPH